MSRVRTMSMVAILIYVVVAAPASAQTSAREPRSRAGAEASTFFGAMIAGKELDRGINATGGHEALIARLGHSAAFGLRMGAHSELVGFEASFLSHGNSVQVRNEFGVRFAHHGEQPLICSGDALFYPFRKAIRAGKLRPYLTSGIGGILFSVDLDNIDGQELRSRFIWNAGGGMKVYMNEDQDLYLDFRFTNHRLLSGMNSVDLRSITVGLGYRF